MGAWAAEPILCAASDVVRHDRLPRAAPCRPASPERSAWIGGHGTEPYEQNTQQSPVFGRSVAPQPLHW